ncbi:TetR family transcriptional regulator [Kocuria sp. M1R5S2]|uniref:TetR family transcriptional regulator n=1 Tax=Kocuria rhizosphaerae TaxID=3376285 RepID=UPI0037B24AD9
MALNRPAVVDAAWELLRTYGLGDLTMRRLARELEVQPGALYWHVANKQELLLALAERMLAPVGEDEDRSPADLLRALRRAVLAVRDGADVVAVAHALAPHELPPTAQLVARLRANGLDDVAARQGALALVRFGLGSVAAQQTRTAIGGSTPAQDAADEEDFEAGLAVLLRGLAVR